MLVLAIDAATRFSGVALLEERRVLAEYLVDSSLTHSTRLLPAIDMVFRDCERSIRDLQGVIVTIGPGSFTGLRIGLSHAKGIAHSLGIPIVGVSTLLLWACSIAPFTPIGSLLLPLLDARRGEYYSALYEQNGDNALPLCEEAARSAEEIGNLMQSAFKSDKGLTITGDIPPSTHDALRQVLGANVSIAAPRYSRPSPVTLANLGLERLLLGQSDDLYTLTPVYLRVSEAQRKREEQLQTPL